MNLSGLRTIGILGGGQLARMTIEAAMRYGITVHVLDKNGDAPAAAYTRFFTQGDPQDFETVMRFAAACDAITIDSEHVNAAALTTLEEQGKIVAPQGKVLATIQNKCRQKEFFAQKNIATAPFQIFASRDALLKANLKYPCVVKKATHGYDGYGVKLLRSAADLADTFEGELLVEEQINIAKELAVIVATDMQGNSVAYEPVEMVFDTERNILKYQLCPAALTKEEIARVQALASTTAKKLGIHGLVAVEMFLTIDGKLLVNEMAPRPHNSGHHTIEAAATSQYENLVRILSGMPLGSTANTSPSLMMNLLGPAADERASFDAMITRALAMRTAHVHWYGKKDLRPYRKLGHITLVGEIETIQRDFEELAR